MTYTRALMLLIPPSAMVPFPAALPTGWRPLAAGEDLRWMSRVHQATARIPWLLEEDLRPRAVREEGETALLCQAGPQARLWYVLRLDREHLAPEFSGDWTGFLAAETLYILDE